MSRYLLDTNAVNALFNLHQPLTLRVREANRRGARVGTCEPVAAELYFGLEYSGTRAANVTRVERGLQGLVCWPFDRAAARAYGRIAADLERRGRRIQAIDIMVAAIALSLGNCTVVTTDSDLSAIPGLSVVDWTKP